MLTSVYDSQFQLMLERVAIEHSSSGTRLTPFWPARGIKYPSRPGLVVVGRAVNGLEDNVWLPAKMSSSEERTKLVDTLRGASEGRSDCPLAWVTKPTEKYNPNRSAFWRFGRRVHESLCGSQPDWSSHICWTNLYKISPAAGGNPSAALQRTQEPFCIELLTREISTWNPEIVLVLTGADWFQPFGDAMEIDFDKNAAAAKDCSFVQKVGRTENAIWIVGKHPQGKPETAFLHEVEQVLNFFQGENTGDRVNTATRCL